MTTPSDRTYTPPLFYKRSSLFNLHLDEGAKFGPLAGWQVPLYYTTIADEHWCVRQKVGLFDLSHKSRLRLVGAEAEAFLDFILTQSLASKAEEITQSPMCYGNGGIIDLVRVWRTGPEEFWLNLNAETFDSAYLHLCEQAQSFEVTIEDLAQFHAQFCLHGPAAEAVLKSLVASNLLPHKPNHITEVLITKVACTLARTTLGGESGFDIICQADLAERLVQSLREAGQPHGLKLCGWQTLSSITLEACVPMAGVELTEGVTPHQAGLSHRVRKDSLTRFIGKEALADPLNLSQKVIFFSLEDTPLAVPQADVYCGARKVGYVLASALSPVLNRPIGSAIISLEEVDFDNLTLRNGDRTQALLVATQPFYPQA